MDSAKFVVRRRVRAEGIEIGGKTEMVAEGDDSLFLNYAILFYNTLVWADDGRRKMQVRI